MRRRGFTIIETIMVIVIIGLLTAVIAIANENLTAVRTRVAANRILDDIRYAQRLAVSRQIRTWVVFNVPGNSYSVYSGPDAASRVTAVHPLSRGSYIVQLGDGEFRSVTITDADFERNQELEFDSCGTPFDGSGGLLASSGFVELNGSLRVTVTPATGVAEVSE